jgi:hypothetical protein
VVFAGVRAFLPYPALLMRARAFGLGVSLLLLALTGCGSKSQSVPSLDSQGLPEGSDPAALPAGWVVISGSTYDAGSTIAELTVLVTDPGPLKLRITSTPDVVTVSSYEARCDARTQVGRRPGSTTPLTRPIVIPLGGGPGAANDVQCFISARASKPADATMTLTILKRIAGSRAPRR